MLLVPQAFLANIVTYPVTFQALSDFNLLGIVLSSVRCVAFGFGFTELVLPMLADMEVPAAATVSPANTWPLSVILLLYRFTAF